MKISSQEMLLSLYSANFFLSVSGLQGINVGHTHAEAHWECIDWTATVAWLRGESPLLHMQAHMRILEDAWRIWTIRSKKIQRGWVLRPKSSILCRKYQWRGKIGSHSIRTGSKYLRSSRKQTFQFGIGLRWFKYIHRYIMVDSLPELLD